MPNLLMSNETLHPLLLTLISKLQHISEQIDTLIAGARPSAPNYRYPIAAYWNFDWNKLDAKILNEDKDGPAQVLWARYVWTRRSAEGKFGTAIWFSRPDGRDENNETRYLRLITFKDGSDPEPLTTKAQYQRPAVTASPPAAPVASTTPTETDATTTEQTAERWQQQAIAAREDRVFDYCFFNANPQWGNPAAVSRLRQQIGTLEQFRGRILYDALKQYEAQFAQLREQKEREEAHADALTAAKRFAAEQLIATKQAAETT